MGRPRKKLPKPPRYVDFSRHCEYHAPLHWTTAPAAIARRQRVAVAAAVRRVGACPARVSEDAILPVEVVRRRMAELGIEPES